MAISRKLPCSLTDEDILDRGRQLANANHDKAQIEDEKADANRDFTKSINSIAGRITELTNAIRDRVETRDVECYIENDHSRLKRALVRRDTGETVEEYEMTEAERQGSLI